jgi:hypothetical protein
LPQNHGDAEINGTSAAETLKKVLNQGTSRMMSLDSYQLTPRMTLEALKRAQA